MSFLKNLFSGCIPAAKPEPKNPRRSHGGGGSQESGLGKATASSSAQEVEGVNQSPDGFGEKESMEVVGGDGDGTVVTAVEGTEPERETWGSKLGYILTLVGYAVGFGNIWRFPFLMHSNGGVAFLIPYGVMLVFAGIPLFFLELALGQRLRKGALGSWNEISPYLGGLGIACGLTCYFVELYYNTLVAWVLLYFFDSFRNLKWSSCADLPTLKGERKSNTSIIIDSKSYTVPEECLSSNQPTKYYWYRRMLDISPSITEPGNFNPWMFLVLTIAWATVLGILVKGIKTSEKVVYFTALFPYVTLTIFFIANFFQPGWLEGYQILLRPKWEVLLDSSVWLKAGSQIFFSLGVAYGCLIVFASYLPSNNNCYRDAVSVSIINCATSLYAAIVLFPVFGSIGRKKFNSCKVDRLIDALVGFGVGNYSKYNEDQRKDLVKAWDFPNLEGDITKIFQNGHNIPSTTPFTDPVQSKDCNLEKFIRNSGSGTSLVFIGFAEAVLSLPFPPIWSIMFFLMLLTLGIDSSFGTLEGAIAVLVDMKLIKLPRWAITCIVVASLYVLSMMFCWGWGYYILDFIDQFVANWSLLIIGFFETVGVAWVYGLAKFSYDIKLMTGSRPNMFILLCWKFITPCLILGILVTDAVQQFMGGYHGTVYNTTDVGIQDPPPKQIWWIIFIGYLMLLSIIMWVPIQAILWTFKKSLLKTETPAYFPEQELRAERNLEQDDDEEFTKIDQLVMGRSIQDFQEHHLSKSNLAMMSTPNSPTLSGPDVSTLPKSNV